MDFTREPIIESVITPKEGCTLAVRSSKGTGQEEYFVDAVEIVSFGNALFFRSLERPKNFLLPVSDYEILEVRETRLVLKNVGLDRSIKIAGGRDSALRTANRGPQDKADIPTQVGADAQPVIVAAPKGEPAESAEVKPDVKLDKKRDRRKNYKRKKGRDEQQGDEAVKSDEQSSSTEKPAQDSEGASASLADAALNASLPAVFSSLLPPPSTLISETIARYKDNALFRGAFFVKEESAQQISDQTENLEVDHPHLQTPHDEEVIEMPSISLDLPAYIPPEISEEEQERIYQERRSLRLKSSSPAPNQPETNEESPAFSPEDNHDIYSKEFSDSLTNHHHGAPQEGLDDFVEEQLGFEFKDDDSDFEHKNHPQEDFSKDDRDLP